MIGGQFYRQFALTVAIATFISAFNSLTLSPALATYFLPGAGPAINADDLAVNEGARGRG